MNSERVGTSRHSEKPRQQLAEPQTREAFQKEATTKKKTTGSEKSPSQVGKERTSIFPDGWKLVLS